MALRTHRAMSFSFIIPPVPLRGSEHLYRERPRFSDMIEASARLRATAQFRHRAHPFGHEQIDAERATEAPEYALGNARHGRDHELSVEEIAADLHSQVR